MPGKSSCASPKSTNAWCASRTRNSKNVSAIERLISRRSMPICEQPSRNSVRATAAGAIGKARFHGQLTAGIAHELNNPINFVSSSAQSLRDFEDLNAIIDLVKAMDPAAADLNEQVNGVKEKLSQLDIEFTQQEIEELLNGIEDVHRSYFRNRERPPHFQPHG